MKLLFLLVLFVSLQSFGATLYVRSTDGSDADSGATWALAKATLAGAFAAAVAGDTIYVSQVHAETQASAMLLTSPGTAAAPCKVICGSDASEPPTALATTSTITTTSTSSITFGGVANCYGITFSAGTGSGLSSLLFTATTCRGWTMEACGLALGGTSSSSRITLGNPQATASLFDLKSTTVRFGDVGQAINLYSKVFWHDTSNAILGTIPTTLCLPVLAYTAPLNVIGVDLSAAGSGKNLINVSIDTPLIAYFQNCKLGDSVAITTGAVAGQGGTEVTLVNCDSTNSNYRYYKQTYQGTITQETAIIRTNGATDGTTAFSRKMVTTANSKYFSPLESSPVEYWNESTNAITITIPVVTDNVTLTDAEAWVEVLYMGTAGFPLGVTLTDRSANILTTPVAQTTDATSAWNTTGLTTPVKQSLSVTVTPTLKGMIRARVMLAKPSTTMYYDPKVIAGARQFMVGQSGVLNVTTADGGSGSGSGSLTNRVVKLGIPGLSN